MLFRFGFIKGDYMSGKLSHYGDFRVIVRSQTLLLIGDFSGNWSDFYVGVITY